MSTARGASSTLVESPSSKPSSPQATSLRLRTNDTSSSPGLTPRRQSSSTQPKRRTTPPWTSRSTQATESTCPGGFSGDGPATNSLRKKGGLMFHGPPFSCTSRSLLRFRASAGGTGHLGPTSAASVQAAEGFHARHGAECIGGSQWAAGPGNLSQKRRPYRTRGGEAPFLAGGTPSTGPRYPGITHWYLHRRRLSVPGGPHLLAVKPLGQRRSVRPSVKLSPAEE